MFFVFYLYAFIFSMIFYLWEILGSSGDEDFDAAFPDYDAV
jgi:hypothetical protein